MKMPKNTVKHEGRSLRNIASATMRESTVYDYRPLESHSKPKRNVVYNACERCRSRKVKCSGSSPCLNCLEHDEDCTYPGRAHERMMQDLQNAERSLEDARKELLDSQNDNSQLRTQMAKMRRDLIASQLEISTLHQQLKNGTAIRSRYSPAESLHSMSIGQAPSSEEDFTIYTNSGSNSPTAFATSLSYTNWNVGASSDGSMQDHQMNGMQASNAIDPWLWQVQLNAMSSGMPMAAGAMSALQFDMPNERRYGMFPHI